MSSQTPSVQTQVLSASVPDVRYFMAVLRGINFASRATVRLNENGLIITVEEARALLGTAYLFSDMFEEYNYHPELGQSQARRHSSATQEPDDDTTFEIPLNTFIDCLNIFGSSTSSGAIKSKRWRKNNNNDGVPNNDDDQQNGPLDKFFLPDNGTAMRMTYNGSGHPLTLFIAEDASGPTATCEITTYDSESQIELPFATDAKVLQIILKSSWLRDALSELDPTCEKITIIGNPSLQRTNSASRSANVTNKPLLRIQATGSFGSTEMDYPNDKEVLQTFECVRNVCFTYKFSHISRSIRALQNSSMTSLQIDEDGTLDLQLQMPSPTRRRGVSSDRSAFTEFRCLPLDNAE